MKAVSYNADNTSKFKNENKNYEAYGALGLSAKLPMLKENEDKTFRDYFTPKFLLRYSPGHMRNIDDNYKLKYDDVFNIDECGIERYLTSFGTLKVHIFKVFGCGDLKKYVYILSYIES